jgi:hypothetical protein
MAMRPYRLDASKRLAADNRRHPVRCPVRRSGFQRLAIKIVREELT